MKKVRRGTVVCLAVTSSIVFHNLVALSDPGPRVRDPQVSDVVVSPELGFVTDTHPAADPSAPLIVHIQEAHTNLEAQRHITGILERLITDHGLKLVLVEGGEGDVGLAYLRTFVTAENRTRVAEKYLTAGIISAEEYLDIASDHPLILWGVEDKALYDQNVEAFLAADALQESMRPALASVREAAGLLADRLFDPAVKELEHETAAFKRQQRSLGEYAGLLERLASGARIAMADYPNLARFLEVRRLEQAIQQPLVQREQAAVIERLSGVAPEQRLEALADQGLGMKQGTIKPAAFYGTLRQLAGEFKVDLNGFPNLTAYLDYLDRSQRIQSATLSHELDALAAAIRRASLTTPERRELETVLQEVDLVEKLLGLALSPDEHRRLGDLDVGGLAARWERFLNAQLARQGLPTRSFQALASLEEQLPVLQRFYASAQQRDEQLVRRALAKLRETGEPIAVLITGGFHGPEITKRLKDAGVGAVVVVPKVTTPTDERLYRAVLKYKSGHGSLNDVMAAGRSQPPVGSTP